MRKWGILVLLVFSLIFPFGAAAVTPTPVQYDLPYPGILPDHPLYFLKTIRDKIVDLFTGDPEKRVEFLLLMADKRLVMGRLLMEKENEKLSHSTISKGEKYFIRATEELVVFSQKNDERGDRLREKLRTASKKHREVIEGIGLKKEWKDVRESLEKIEEDLQ